MVWRLPDCQAEKPDSEPCLTIDRIAVEHYFPADKARDGVFDLQDHHLVPLYSPTSDGRLSA